MNDVHKLINRFNWVYYQPHLTDPLVRRRRSKEQQAHICFLLGLMETADQMCRFERVMKKIMFV